jgi:hypothetical protein
MSPLAAAPWDLPGQVAQAINAWLTSVAQNGLDLALGAIQNLLTATPHFDQVREVSQLWNLMRGIADGFLVVIALIGGILVMVSSTAGTRYTVKLIVSRLLLAALLANLSLSTFAMAVDLNNALNAALLGDVLRSHAFLTGLQGHVVAAGLQGPVFALLSLIAALLLLALVVIYVARTALLILAVIASPLALICYALPQTEGVTWAWWRVTAAAFLLQPVNALLLGIAGRVFFSSGIAWGLDPTSLVIGPLIAIVLLYLLIRTPWWIYNHMIAPETHHRVRSVVSTAVGAAKLVAKVAA